jgi:L-ascorbate metabolism protein UlaG (beta-lactamase superfamily)
VRLSALPPLDAVILSHDHYDHLDRSTIRELAKTTVPFITSLGVGAHLERWGVSEDRVTELDWWETTELRGITITAGPAQHFSGRAIKDRNSTLWASYHLRGRSRSFYYGADSGLTTDFTDIAKKLGPFDMVALEIGAYHPSWGDIHMGPHNALTASRMLGSGLFLPIHWGTFNLGMHAWDEPAETVLREASGAGVSLVMPRLGQPFEPLRGPMVDPWWRSVSATGAPATETPDGDAPLELVPD